MKKPLRDASKDYFQSQQLSPQKLEQLEQLMQTKTQPPKQGARLSFLATAMGVCILVFAIGFGFNNFFSNNYIDISEAIASEVARNHVKMKPLEVNSDNLFDARSYFKRLDFAVTPPSLLDSNTLLGGRYCSIQGVTSAQLRYQSQDGHNLTLYQVEYDASVFGKQPNIDQGMTPKSLMVKGLEIQIWVEKGLLMVSAAEATPDQTKP